MERSLYQFVTSEAGDHLRVIAEGQAAIDPREGAARFEADLATMHRWCRINEQLVIDRHGEGASVYAGFEKLSRIQGVQRRYGRLARKAGQLTLFGLPDWPPPFEARIVPLHTGPLLEEWFVVILSPNYSALIVAQDLAGIDAPRELRRFRAVATHSVELVEGAVALLEQARAEAA